MAKQSAQCQDCSKAWGISEANFPGNAPIEEKLKFLLGYAILAPSGHNTQPWKFSIEKNAIKIFPDLTRRLAVVDSNHRELFISLGCAIENLAIAARHFGLMPMVDSFPKGEEFILVSFSTGKKDDSTLFRAITQRETNRKEFEAKKIPVQAMEKILQLKPEKGITLTVLEESQSTKVSEIIAEANSIQTDSRAFKQELISWMRFNEKETEKSMDGLTMASTGKGNVPGFIGRLFINLFFGSKARNKGDQALIKHSAAFLLLSSEQDSKSSWAAAGQSLERILLALALLGIKASFLNQACEEQKTKAKLQEFKAAKFPQILMRIGYAESAGHSPRRPVEKSLFSHKKSLGKNCFAKPFFLKENL